MRHRRAGERGAVLLLTALLMIALMLVVAIVVVDLGSTRSDRRNGQLAVDTAASSAGRHLADPDSGPSRACSDALDYLRVNLDTPAFTVTSSTTCASFDTACTATGTVARQDIVVATSGGYTTRIHFPLVSGTTEGDRLLQRTSTIGGGAIASTSGVGDLATDACYRMGVELTTRGEAFFGGVAGSTERTSNVHAVVYGRPATDGSEIPAFVMLERVDCGALVENNARGIFVNASTTGPGLIHADSYASGDCGGNTKGYVVYGASLPSNGGPSINVASFIDTTKTPPVTTSGRITVAAADSTNRVAAVVGGNNPGINVTPTGGATPVSRRPVDRKYNSTTSPAISDLHRRAYLALTTDNPPYTANAGCDGVVTPAGASRVLVTCPDYSATTPLPASVTEVEFTGGLSVAQGQTATINATSVVVRGQVSLAGQLTLPHVSEFFVGSRLVVTNNGGLAVNSTLTSTCFNTATPPQWLGSASHTRFVVFGASPALQLDNTSSLCRTTGYLAGPLSAANSHYAGVDALDPTRSRNMLTSGSPHPTCTNELPCPRKVSDGNVATGATFSIGGNATITWRAPDTDTIAGNPSRPGLKDLALWMEGGETASMGSNAELRLRGVLFAPNARLDMRSPTAAVPQNAQFIARSLWLYQGTMRMQPTAGTVVDFPSLGGSSLIR